MRITITTHTMATSLTALIPSWLTRERVLAVILALLFVQMGLPLPVIVSIPPVFACIGLLLLPLPREAAGHATALRPENLMMLGCIFCYVLGVWHSNGEIYRSNIRDLPGLIVGLAVPLLAGTLSVQSAKKVLTKMSRYTWLLTVFIGLLAVYKFVLLLGGQELQWLISLTETTKDSYPGGTSLNTDYNFFGLMMIIGLLCATYLAFAEESSARLRNLCVLTTPLLAFCALFAGSRRVWAVLAALVLYGGLKLLAMLTKYPRPPRTLHTLRTASSLITLLLVLAGLAVARLGVDSALADNADAINSIWERLGTLTTDNATLTDSISPRTDAWEYGINEIIPRYSLSEFFVGRGFDYLREYARAFPRWHALEDYPHNLILSAMHYSGLLGALLLAALFVQQMLKTLRLTKWLGVLVFVIGAALLIFCLPSSNSVFTIYASIMFISFMGQIEIPTPGSNMCDAPSSLQAPLQNAEDASRIASKTSDSAQLASP